MFTIPWIYDQNDTFEEPITFLNTTKYKHSSSYGNTRTITEEPHLLRNTFFYSITGLAKAPLAITLIKD